MLKVLLAKRNNLKELEEKVASAFGEDRESLWENIDRELISWFRGN
jgi:hypothetical protein